MAFISKNIEGLLNQRILEEEKSSRLYLSMSKWLGFNGYFGASKLWKKYSDEESSHAEWAYDYLEKLNLLPMVPPLPEPICEFDGLLDICNKSYQHELAITQSCNSLAKSALGESDFMTLELAQKYLKEQSEEIEKLTTILDRIKMLGGDSISKEGLMLLDKELGG